MADPAFTPDKTYMSQGFHVGTGSRRSPFFSTSRMATTGGGGMSTWFQIATIALNAIGMGFTAAAGAAQPRETQDEKIMRERYDRAIAIGQRRQNRQEDALSLTHAIQVYDGRMSKNAAKNKRGDMLDTAIADARTEYADTKAERDTRRTAERAESNTIRDRLIARSGGGV